MLWRLGRGFVLPTAPSWWLSLAWLASKFLKEASLRHVVWLTAFGTLLVLPVAALVVPPQITIQRTVAAAREVPSYIEPVADAATVSVVVLAALE